MSGTDVLIRPHFDNDGKSLIMEHVQDVEPILEHNKMLRAMEQKSDWGRHIANIPNVISLKWIDEEYARGNVNIRFLGPGFDELCTKKLKDPEWAYLRVDNPSNPFHLGWRP